MTLCCVAERNLNPKQACLKRREEEKGEIPGTHGSSSDPLSGRLILLVE